MVQIFVVLRKAPNILTNNLKNKNLVFNSYEVNCNNHLSTTFHNGYTKSLELLTTNNPLLTFGGDHSIAISTISQHINFVK